MSEKKILLRGIGASAGVITGAVRLILDSSHNSKMKKGDVLVTTFTNPLFTPAILKASAIVTDEGSIMCHAAIVSREFGIPCVVGTKKATEALTDNMEVTVDGKKGIVYK